MTSPPATIKGNWIHAATVAYVKRFHPEVWAEAQLAARARWTEEHPDDPWKPKARKEPIQW